MGHGLMVSSTPPAPTILHPFLLGFPKLHLMFECGSLYLRPSVADDDWDRHLSVLLPGQKFLKNIEMEDASFLFIIRISRCFLF